MERITVISSVNNWQRYKECVADSFERGSVEIAAIDGAGVSSAATVLNKGLDTAKTDLVVCCHQDVKFPPGWTDKLFEQIEKIDDPDMGVLGTFGVAWDGSLAGNVDDPHHVPPTAGLPMKAQTVDEHCMIFRKSTRLRFDELLGGWHFYGADICFQALNRRLNNYIIDARVEHLSGGQMTPAYYEMKERFIRKWKLVSPLSVVRTTCGVFTL
jgi:hypothetical protein